MSEENISPEEETELMEEAVLSLEESTELAYEKLLKNMPSIGFISRKKRIKAYIEITNIADYMLKNEEVSMEGMLFILSMMMRKCADFQKAATMTAFSLDSIGKDVLSPIGLNFNLEIRKNLNLPKTHHTKPEQELHEESTEEKVL